MVQQNGDIQVGTSALLAELKESTELSIANLSGPKTSAEGLSVKIDEMSRQIELAGQIQDKEKRDDRIRILTATMQQIRAEDGAETKDFAEAVMGLSVIAQSIGGDFEKLGKPSDSELKLLSGASDAVKTAESDLIATDGLTKWFGIQSRAKNAAQAALDQAKTNQTEVEAGVKKMARERLRNANIEESLQQYRYMVDKTIGIMQSRHKTTAAQLKILTARKAEVFKIKEEAAKALERLDQELNGLESDLRAAEDLKSTMINGAPDYVEQERIVSNLMANVEEVRGNRNVANTIFLSKEKAATELEIHEISTRKTFDTQKIWIAKAMSDSEEQQITFVSRVEQAKAMGDFEVIESQVAVGARIDQANSSFMAASSAAADRARMKMLEDHPNQMRALELIRTAQAEHISQIRQREGAMIAEFKTRWGIDPFAGSYLHGDGAEGASAPQTSAAM